MVKENIGYDGISPSISERYLCQSCHYSLLACETYFILCQHYLHLFEIMIGLFLVGESLPSGTPGSHQRAKIKVVLERAQSQRHERDGVRKARVMDTYLGISARPARFQGVDVGAQTIWGDDWAKPQVEYLEGP